MTRAEIQQVKQRFGIIGNTEALSRAIDYSIAALASADGRHLAIVLKSNYGEIGGKVWKGFGVIRASAGKIKLPGHYLLSVLNN